MGTGKMDLIRFQNVCPQVFINNSDIVSDVWRQQLEFKKGQTYLVEAESGKGKSTFCSYLMGYRHDYQGNIFIDGKDIEQYQVSDWVAIRRRNISCLFQDLRLFPELTAWENVDIKNSLTHWKSRDEIEQWFFRMGIADKKDTRVGKMSFGQQQRVAMIRALAQPFDFLLADEPISHLDDVSAKTMGVIMMEEAHKQKAGVLVTSIGKRLDLPYDHVLQL